MIWTTSSRRGNSAPPGEGEHKKGDVRRVSGSFVFESLAGLSSHTFEKHLFKNNFCPEKQEKGGRA